MSQSRPVEQVQPATAKPEKHSFFHNLVCDSAPGAMVAYSLFPFENLKKYVQRTGLYPWASAQTEKFVPYRGSTVFAANIIPTTAIQLTTNRLFQEVMPANPTEAQKALASMASGATGAVMATAMENYVLKMQVLNKERLAANPTAKPAAVGEVLRAVFQHRPYGPLTGYTGVGLRDSIFTLNMLYFTPEAVKYAEQRFGKDSNYVIAARLATGFFGAAVSHPADAIATKMQEPTDGPRKSLTQTASDMFNNEGGIKRFTRGLPSRILLFTLFSNGIPFAQKGTNELLAKGGALFSESDVTSGPKKNP